MPDGTDQRFNVILHDVTPRYSREMHEIADLLDPWIGQMIEAAVVPEWHAEPEHRISDRFAREVDQRFANILLHGHTHQRSVGRGLATRISQGADEFNGYSHEEAHRRLRVGQSHLADAFGRRAIGFIAPTFHSGPLKIERFPEAGLQYQVGYRALERVGGRPVPLATWCWDMGPSRLLCRLGYRFGNWQHRLIPKALPCLALHPVDLERGFGPQIVEVVKRLIDAGRQPVLSSHYAAASDSSAA